MSLDWLSNAQKKDSTKLFPLSANTAFLLNKGSKKKKSEEMKLYLLQKQVALQIYLHPVWPLPVWLGGRYTNIVKPGYPLRCPTKAQFWTISHLHLAVCTTVETRTSLCLYFTSFTFHPTALLLSIHSELPISC